MGQTDVTLEKQQLDPKKDHCVAARFQVREELNTDEYSPARLNRILQCIPDLENSKTVSVTSISSEYLVSCKQQKVLVCSVCIS